MKKFLLSLTLLTALVGLSFNAKAQCSISNLVFNVKSVTSGANNACTMVFDIGWDQVNNGGYEWSVAHIWEASNYPTFDYKKPPTSTELNNSKVLGTVGIKLVNGQWAIQSIYPHGNTPMLTGTLTVTSLPGQVLRFFVRNVSTTFSACPANLNIKGDVWGSQNPNAQNNHCTKQDLTFVPPVQDLTVTGSLTCAYKDGKPDNKFQVGMTSVSTSPINVTYDVYVDNGDGSFNSATDLKVSARTATASVSSLQSYNGGPFDYTPYSKEYNYRNSTLWIDAKATTFLGDQFTRLYKMVNTCTDAVVAPVPSDDNFPEKSTNIIKGNVFGGHARWTNELGADSEFTLSVASGIDQDITDPALDNMIFEQVGSTTYNGCTVDVPQDLLKFYKNGTFEINRGELSCLLQVVFKYNVTNTITGLTSGVATVTLEFAPQSTLPVTYKSFSANRTNNNQVLLEWVTATEVNNRGFHVQRNVDGTWKNIGFVFSQADGGNSTSELKYAFKDANNSKGISQYRVLQVDIDGKGKYSDVRSVRGEQTAARLTIFPNPSNSGSFNILFEESNTVRDVIVSDVSGRQVKQIRNTAGNSLAVEGLTDGFYTVQVINRSTGIITTEKVIIKKR